VCGSVGTCCAFVQPRFFAGQPRVPTPALSLGIVETGNTEFANRRGLCV
jgi:hypothetical protein